MNPLAGTVGLTLGGVAIGAGVTNLIPKFQGFSTDLRTEEHAPTPLSLPVSQDVQNDLKKFPFGVWKQWTGNPGPISPIFIRKAYIGCYDRVKRHPAWIAEHLTAASVSKPPPVPSTPLATDSAAGDIIPGQGVKAAGGDVDRAYSVFKEDSSIPKRWRSRLADYAGSGFDRGHMAPAADARFSQNAMDETFLLSNIAPQVGDGFNRDYWAWVERFCRRLTGSFDDVFVFTVPLYMPKKMPDGKFRVSYEVLSTGGVPSVSVPTHFAKVILASGPIPQPSPPPPGLPSPPQNSSSTALTSVPPPPPPPGSQLPGSTIPGNVGLGRNTIAVGAFILPNDRIPEHTPLKAFEAPVDAVERASGLEFFSQEVTQRARRLCDCVPCAVEIMKFDNVPKNKPKASKL